MVTTREGMKQAIRYSMLEKKCVEKNAKGVRKYRTVTGGRKLLEEDKDGRADGENRNRNTGRRENTNEGDIEDESRRRSG